MLTRKPRKGDRISYREGVYGKGTVTRVEGRICHWQREGDEAESTFIWGFNAPPKIDDDLYPNQLFTIEE